MLLDLLQYYVGVSILLIWGLWGLPRVQVLLTVVFIVVLDAIEEAPSSLLIAVEKVLAR